MDIAARSYAPGEAQGFVLVLQEPLSFWGGIDAVTGRVIDLTHSSLGASITGTVLLMPGGRGSSSSSSVLAESLRLGTGPAAIVLATPDPILTVGALVACALYGIRCPIVVCAIDELESGTRVRVTADETGSARVEVL